MYHIAESLEKVVVLSTVNILSSNDIGLSNIRLNFRYGLVVHLTSKMSRISLK